MQRDHQPSHVGGVHLVPILDTGETYLSLSGQYESSLKDNLDE